jgi:hypothetical protein
MEPDKLARLKEYGEFILRRIDSVPQNPSQQEDWVSSDMSYIIAPSSLAGRGLGVGFLYLIMPGSAVKTIQGEHCPPYGIIPPLLPISVYLT